MIKQKKIAILILKAGKVLEKCISAIQSTDMTLQKDCKCVI